MTRGLRNCRPIPHTFALQQVAKEWENELHAWTSIDKQQVLWSLAGNAFNRTVHRDPGLSHEKIFVYPMPNNFTANFSESFYSSVARLTAAPWTLGMERMALTERSHAALWMCSMNDVTLQHITAGFFEPHCDRAADPLTDAS